MKRKLIIIAVAVVVTGSVIALPNNDKEQLNLMTQEETSVPSPEQQHSQQEPLDEAQVVQDTTGEQNTTTEPTVQPQEQAEPQPEPEPFDAQLYAQGELQKLSNQGYSVNVRCFNDLMTQAHNWNMTKAEVDQAVSKVTKQYSSTCAAYATFKQTGVY